MTGFLTQFEADLSAALDIHDPTTRLTVLELLVKAHTSDGVPDSLDDLEKQDEDTGKSLDDPWERDIHYGLLLVDPAVRSAVVHALAKHMPGRHDQSSHGGGAGLAADIPADVNGNTREEGMWFDADGGHMTDGYVAQHGKPVTYFQFAHDRAGAYEVVLSEGGTYSIGRVSDGGPSDALYTRDVSGVRAAGLNRAGVRSLSSDVEFAMDASSRNRPVDEAGEDIGGESFGVGQTRVNAATGWSVTSAPHGSVVISGMGERGAAVRLYEGEAGEMASALSEMADLEAAKSAAFERDLVEALSLADPTTRAVVLELLAKEQPRDRRGRWTSGGGGAGSGATNLIGGPLRSSIPGEAGGPPVPRASLRKAKTVSQIEDVTSQELEATMGRPVPVSFSGLSPAVARETGEGLLMAAQRYPNNDLAEVTTYGPRGTRPTHPGDPTFEAAAVTTTTYGRQHADTMAFNTAGGEGYIRATYASAAAVGQNSAPHPTGTAVHEMGHVITGHNSADITSTQVILQGAARAGAVDSQGVAMHIARNVSIYAASSPHEAMAEAFADVLVNGAGASPLSRDVHTVIDAYYQSANLP